MVNKLSLSCLIISAMINIFAISHYRVKRSDTPTAQIIPSGIKNKLNFIRLKLKTDTIANNKHIKAKLNIEDFKYLDLDNNSIHTNHHRMEIKSFSINQIDTHNPVKGSISITSNDDDLDKGKYFSFYKRVIENYLLKLNLSFYELSNSGELKQNDLMLGKITFDHKGNAQQLKVLKWARDDLIQAKFLETLKNIRKVHNPPSEMIADDKTFTIFYGLKIKI
jgi:hypothetical protein